MSEFLRNNWFVVVIAVIIIAFVSYFIYEAIIIKEYICLNINAINAE